MLLGFAALSPTYGLNRPHGRSIRLLAVTRSHRLEPVECSLRPWFSGQAVVQDSGQCRHDLDDRLQPAAVLESVNPVAGPVESPTVHLQGLVAIQLGADFPRPGEKRTRTGCSAARTCTTLQLSRTRHEARQAP